jgi:hypothetical protein
MQRWAPAIAAVFLGLSAVGFAQTPSIERTVKAQGGRDVRIGVFASIRPDCTAGALPTIRLKDPPKHGKVTVKQAKLRTTNIRQCLAMEVPAFVAIYRSNPNYSGDDVVVLEVINSSGKVQIQTITIKVGPVGNGERI